MVSIWQEKLVTEHNMNSIMKISYALNLAL